MARQIDYYFSLASPWAYIGHPLFMSIASQHGCTINYKPVFLGELFAETGGLPLNKRHPARQRYRMLELQRWREKRGLSFHLHPQNWPFNARLADGVVLAAMATGQDPEPYVKIVYPAVWERQLNLGDAKVIAGLADEAGFPGAKLVEQSGSEAITAVYEKNRDEAIAAGVFGSPAYVLDGEVFWGQDRLELLADALASKRKSYRSDA